MKNGGTKYAEQRLNELAGFARLEKQGIPFGRGAEMEPSGVINGWKKEFPETYNQFENDYLEKKNKK